MTIKTNGAKRAVSPKTYTPESRYQSPPKAAPPEREPQKTPKFFQGVTDWSERKESAPPRHFASKAFRDELTGTLERNRMRGVPPRDEIRPPRYGKDENSKSDEEPRKKSVKNEIRYGSRGDLHYHHGGSDDSRNLKTQREDLGYMSGSRNDVRPRHDVKEDLDPKARKTHTSYLHREDSGYVKDSREDVRYNRNIPVREDSFNKDSGEDEKHLKYNNSAIQRDDSAYISS